MSEIKKKTADVWDYNGKPFYYKSDSEKYKIKCNINSYPFYVDDLDEAVEFLEKHLHIFIPYLKALVEEVGNHSE